MGAIPHGYERSGSVPAEPDNRTWDQIVMAQPGAMTANTDFLIEYLADAYAVKYDDDTYQAITVDRGYRRRLDPSDAEIARFLLASPRRPHVPGEWLRYEPMPIKVAVDPDGSARVVGWDV